METSEKDLLSGIVLMKRLFVKYLDKVGRNYCKPTDIYTFHFTINSGIVAKTGQSLHFIFLSCRSTFKFSIKKIDKKNGL